jgi:phospholipid/cholesterol/gamma-HCH transport system substrate-binding protein
MPRTRSLAFSELKIGILSVIALVIAAVVIFMLSGQGGFFWQRYSLKVRFPNAAGLKTGAPVRLAGVEVGSVKRLEFVGPDVDVTFDVSRDQQSRITEQSTATIGSMGLLGQATVDVTASARGTPVPAWGYVRTGALPQQIADVTATATKGLEQATELLQDIREGRGSVGKLFTNEDLYRQLDALVKAAHEVTSNINRGGGTVGALMNDRAAYNNLQASLKNLQAITDRINAGQGSLGKFLHDEQMAASLKSTASNVDSLTSRMNRGEGTVGKLMTDRTLFDRLDSISKRLDDLTVGLNTGEGSAGQFLKNREVYDNLNGAANQLKSLIADIRKDPKKYLNVKVSLF